MSLPLTVLAKASRAGVQRLPAAPRLCGTTSTSSSSRPWPGVLADTKTRQSHVVDLDPGTCEILAGYAATVEEPVGDGYVFSDDNGATAWKPSRVTKTFGRYRRALGLRSFRLHDLRHFMATEMLEAGVPIVTVSRRLAHRRVSTTMDHYAHSVPGGDAQASAVLRAVFETAAGAR